MYVSGSFYERRGDLVLNTAPLYDRDEELRMLAATADLSQRYSPHWWGGPLLSAPGGRRVRQTLIEPLEDEIAREARRWREDA